MSVIKKWKIRTEIGYKEDNNDAAWRIIAKTVTEPGQRSTNKKETGCIIKKS
jgi:hypothetical protein